MMATGAQQVLPFVARSISTSAVPAMSALVQATSAKSSGGLASLFSLGGSRIDTPLNEPLPVPAPHRSKALSAPPKLATSTLANGVQVAAIDTASPISSVALFIPAGSAYETAESSGASKALELLAFKATANRTTFRLTRELEKIGATSSVVAGREVLSFAVSATKLNTPESVEMLLDAVLNARFAFHEVRDTLEAAQAAVAEVLRKRPLDVLNEIAHRAAFDGGLAQPLLVDPSALAALTADKVRAFLSSRLSAGGALLAAVGTDHAELLQLAQPLFDAASPETAAAGAAGAAPASSYLGGSISVLSSSSPLSHTLLAFEARGGYSDAAGHARAHVVAALLKEGLQAQPTLPHGRASHEVLRGLEPFTNLYQRTGLVGAVVSSAPGSSAAALDALTKKFEGLAKGVSEAALSQAKGTVVADHKAAASTSTGLVQLVGRALMAGNKYDPNSLPSAVAAITGDELKSYVAKLLQSPPTLASYGSLTSLPRYDTIVKRFK